MFRISQLGKKYKLHLCGWSDAFYKEGPGGKKVALTPDSGIETVAMDWQNVRAGNSTILSFNPLSTIAEFKSFAILAYSAIQMPV